VEANGVERASTVISLATQVPYRTLPLVRAATENGPPRVGRDGPSEGAGAQEPA
jgi:hypothetical protein